MLEHEQLLRHQVAREVLQNFEETIAALLQICASLPPDEFRDRFLTEISGLDSVQDDIRNSIDSMQD